MLSSAVGTPRYHPKAFKRPSAFAAVEKSVKQISLRLAGEIPTTEDDIENNSKKQELRQYRNLSKRRLIRINISGIIFETYEATLDKYPETILGTRDKRHTLLDEKRNEIFLNRPRAMFEAILFYYQSSGMLVRPPHTEMNDFVEECYFYGISPKAVKTMKQREHWLFKKPRRLPQSISKFQYFCWVFFDNPREFIYPWLAFIYWFLSYSLILTSIILSLLETEFILHARDHLEKHIMEIEKLEAILNLWFCVELAARFLSNPWPKHFVFVPLNTCEILSFSASLIGYLSSHKTKMILLRTGRILRTVRLVRISRCSTLIKTACSVVQASINEVVAVTFIISINCIFAGSIMYFIEMEEENTKFRSIPDSMWWAVQTVLCVGYGDIVPTSVIGKSVGGLVLYLGVLMTTVMLLSLGGRIFDMYLKELMNSDLEIVASQTGEREDYEIKYKE